MQRVIKILPNLVTGQVQWTCERESRSWQKMLSSATGQTQLPTEGEQNSVKHTRATQMFVDVSRIRLGNGLNICISSIITKLANAANETSALSNRWQISTFWRKIGPKHTNNLNLWFCGMKYILRTRSRTIYNFVECNINENRTLSPYNQGPRRKFSSAGAALEGRGLTLTMLKTHLIQVWMIIELITILQYTLIIDTVKLRKDAVKNSVFFF